MKSSVLVAYLIFSASAGQFVIVHAPSYSAALQLVK